MEKYSTFIGMDLGDVTNQVCMMNRTGKIIRETKVATSAVALEAFFGGMKDAVIAMETGTHSPWISRLLEKLGLRVYVANSRKVQLITENEQKNDKRDARTLARLVRADPELLHPIKHRSEQAQRELLVLQVRDTQVRTRTGQINAVRGMVKSAGLRIPKCSPESFAKKATEALPETLLVVLKPLLDIIATLTAQIQQSDAQIEGLCARHPETELFRGIKGVGPVTALAFSLVIDNPHRFGSSRDVGVYIGLTPRRAQSGERNPQLRITKAGNPFLRRLLILASHYILGPFGPDTDLRRWGMIKGGDSKGREKKRAVVAVARKLAVTLHTLWVNGMCYEPLLRSGAVAEEEI
jgi:transposase